MKSVPSPLFSATVGERNYLNRQRSHESRLVYLVYRRGAMLAAGRTAFRWFAALRRIVEPWFEPELTEKTNLLLAHLPLRLGRLIVKTYQVERTVDDVEH